MLVTRSLVPELIHDTPGKAVNLSSRLAVRRPETLARSDIRLLMRSARDAAAERWQGAPERAQSRSRVRPFTGIQKDRYATRWRLRRLAGVAQWQSPSLPSWS